MQNKFELFDKLPEELELQTAQNLSTRDLVNLAQTSKYHLSLFKPMVDVRKLLHHVVRGKHDAVQLILIDDISLMLKRGKVTDCSGREFENISSFEYALWAMDKHMWAKMMSYIPQNEEGRKVFAQLIAQYNKVNTDGVTYRLNGKTITEQHFDFENTLIKELQTQVDSIHAPGVNNWDAIDKQWREGVGGAQKRLPMHIVDEYCSNDPFYPVPKFTSQPISSKQFYDWTTNKSEDWFSVDSKLGSKFAIYKAVAYGLGAACVYALGGGEYPAECFAAATFDLDAMKALYEVRTQDLINLKLQLKEQAGLENHYQVVPM
ncbi:F-box protein [Legionella longbeachae]|uniref:F-box protein n=1 Tax=Legionella longbeachae TaxID=450 RepID=UPI001247F06A|nr:F-box protein [Legionella longbeachae]QEY52005.1 F-box protein [Legionella longbeachae]